MFPWNQAAADVLSGLRVPGEFCDAAVNDLKHRVLGAALGGRKTVHEKTFLDRAFKSGRIECKGTGMRSLPALVALFLVLFPALATASRVVVIEPVKKEIAVGSAEVVDLGVVGPGQKVEVAAERGTGEPHPYYGKEKTWDKLSVVEDSLPPGWRGIDSLLYESPLKAFVIVANDAPDGEYVFSLSALDELEGTPPQVINARVVVSRNVLSLDVLTPLVTAGGGQPAVYSLRVSNTGSASDVFEISVSSGLPSRWTYTKQVFVPWNSSVDVQYEVVSEGYGRFPVVFKAVSLSSSEIAKEASGELVAESSLYLEARAASHGILLFPSVEQAIYSLTGFLANVLSYFF